MGTTGAGTSNAVLAPRRRRRRASRRTPSARRGRRRRSRTTSVCDAWGDSFGGAPPRPGNPAAGRAAHWNRCAPRVKAGHTPARAGATAPRVSAAGRTRAPAPRRQRPPAARRSPAGTSSSSPRSAAAAAACSAAAVAAAVAKTASGLPSSSPRRRRPRRREPHLALRRLHRLRALLAARCDAVVPGCAWGTSSPLRDPADVRVDPGELGAEQEDLRRVVDPHQQHDQRAGGAVARGDAALADVQADQRLADGEQQRGHRRADPDVAPGDAAPAA